MDFFKHALLICILCISWKIVHTQPISPNFSLQVVTSSSSISGRVASNSSGNVAISSEFIGTKDFDIGQGVSELTSTQNNQADLAIASYTPNGALNFLSQIRSVSGTVVSEDIVMDATGAVYITGLFFGSIDFDPSAQDLILTNVGTSDGFLAKYNSDGSLDWAFNFGLAETNAGYGVAIDDNGDLLLCGTFSQLVRLNPANTSDQVIGTDGLDIFVAKYSNDGTYQWAFGMGNAGQDYARNVVTDSENNIYITGVTSGQVDFDPSSGINNVLNSGSTDGFIAKYDAGGNYLNAFGLGGTSTDAGWRIACDDADNIFVSGYFSSEVDFDPGAATKTIESNGSRDIFVAGYDKNGALIDAFGIGGTSVDALNGMDVSPEGSIYITGGYRETVDFNPSNSTESRTSDGISDVYIAKFNPDFSLDWVHTTGSELNDQGTDILVNSNNLYVTGNFGGEIELDPNSNLNNISPASNLDLFFVAYEACTKPEPPVINGPNPITFCEGTSQELSATGEGTVYWYTEPSGDLFAEGDTIQFEATATTLFSVTTVTCTESDATTYTVNVDACVGLEENKPDQFVYIYPTKAYRQLTINCNRDASYHLMDLLGNVVRSGIISQGENQISIDSVPKGIYLINISNDSNSKTEKIYVK